MTEEQKNRKRALLGSLFTPGAPVSTQDLFAGRIAQIDRVLDAVFQVGTHPIIFGERGVGKTSLANVILKILTVKPPGMEKPLMAFAHRVPCDTNDSFVSAWRKFFKQIVTTYSGTGFGQQEVRVQGETLASRIPDDAGSSEVMSVLQTIPRSVVVFDEFDRLRNQKSIALFADCIKTLSDAEVNTTIIIVGVADNISNLIREHSSIKRNIKEIKMDRMTQLELQGILTTRYPKCSMNFEQNIPIIVGRLSQGFPHYSHALGLEAGRAALNRDSDTVMLEDIKTATKQLVENAENSIQEEYVNAVHSSHKESLYKEVLLACALTEADERGFFVPAGVRAPMTAIMRKKFDIPTFARHLSNFCKENRGNVLQRQGQKHGYRYRFSNPLLRPYVYLRGITSELVPEDYSPFIIPPKKEDELPFQE